MLRTFTFVSVIISFFLWPSDGLSQKNDNGNSEKIIASYVYNFISSIEFTEPQKQQEIRLLVLTTEKEHKDIYKTIRKMYDGKRTKSGKNKKLIHVENTSNMEKQRITMFCSFHFHLKTTLGKFMNYLNPTTHLL